MIEEQTREREERARECEAESEKFEKEKYEKELERKRLREQHKMALELAEIQSKSGIQSDTVTKIKGQKLPFLLRNKAIWIVMYLGSIDMLQPRVGDEIIGRFS